MNKTTLKQQRRAAMLAQNYDDEPPYCKDCTFYLPACAGNERAQPHLPMCNIGKFFVRPYGACDRWQGVRGELIEG